MKEMKMTNLVKMATRMMTIKIEAQNLNQSLNQRENPRNPKLPTPNKNQNAINNDLSDQ